MNRRLRVLLVGRHFWPHGSIDSAAFLYQLAIGLDRRGIDVEVLSPRYASSWPEELVLREIPVHRPAAAPRSEWSMGRYVRHLTGWLREHAAAFDVLFVDSIREESSAAIEAMRTTGCRCLLRYGGWGLHSDGLWWQTSRSARRCGALGRTAHKVISKDASSHRALLAEGYLPSRIQRIDEGFALGVSHTDAARRVARKNLAAVNSDLIAEDDAPVIVCIGRMTSDSGINLLANSARHLVARYPDLRIWFIGDGPHRDSIYETLRRDGVRASIAMPGSFSDLDDVLAAADVYLQSDEQGLDHFMRAAISAELPLVTIDNESTRTVVMGSGPHDPTSFEAASLVRWYQQSATSKSLRTALMEVLDDLQSHRENATSLRRLTLRTRPQSESLDAYVNLMQQLAEQKSGHDSSVEAAS